ncbi:MAG TPA: M1 family aminopeptidase, partial [Balneolales bacterium]|nr:M1 family aminopeptidase [Balneolales bacterium]
ATVFGDFYFVNNREALDQDYLNANIHELVHHWFGDYVTARAPVEGWLHESFATYYAKLFEKKIYGEDHFEWMRYQEQQAALDAARKGTLPLLSLKAGYERIYKKGSAILGMLSWIYGKQSFKRVINYYLTQHPYGLVDTQDFYRAFQHVLGISPKWFFDEWIYQGGLPYYHVTWNDSTNSNLTVVHVRQSTVDTAESHLFRMPVDLEVHYHDGNYDSVKTWIQNASTDITIPKISGKRVSYILFDPCSHIIKATDFPRSLPELEAQASSARFMIDRYDAIKAMDSIAVGLKLNFLISRYHTETFPELKAEIIRQLAPDSSSATLNVMQQALRDSSVTVRLAALTAMPKIPDPLRPDVEKMLTDSSYTVIATSLVRLVQSHDGNLSKYLNETKDVNGPGHMVSILWNEINVQLGNEYSLHTLVDYTSSSYGFQTRINAAQVLGQMNYLNQSFAGSLLQGIATANYRLAGAFRDICRHFASNDQKMNMIKKVFRDSKWTKIQESRLKSFFESLPKDEGND